MVPAPGLFSLVLGAAAHGAFGQIPRGRAAPSVPGQATVMLSPPACGRFGHDGVGEVVDFMPVAGDRATDRHRVVRMIRVMRGPMQFELHCQPRFNFGRDNHEVVVLDDGPTFRGANMTVNISAARHGGLAAQGQVEPRETASSSGRRCPPATWAAWSWRPPRPARHRR